MKPNLPKDLLDVLSDMESARELRPVLLDLLTPGEVEALCERWAIVKLLAQGLSQRDVAQKLGASVTTVSRGSRQMKYGARRFRKGPGPAAGAKVIVRPTLEHVLAHSGPESHAVLSTSLLVDGDTPIAVFHKMAGDTSNSFLLESVEGGELMGRYSFLGFGISDGFQFSGGRGRLTHGGELREVEFDDPLRVLEAELAGIRMLADPGLPRFQGGAVGYLGIRLRALFRGRATAGAFGARFARRHSPLPR